VPVISTLLKLSPKEKEYVLEIIKGEQVFVIYGGEGKPANDLTIYCTITNHISVLNSNYSNRAVRNLVLFSYSLKISSLSSEIFLEKVSTVSVFTFLVRCYNCD